MNNQDVKIKSAAHTSALGRKRKLFPLRINLWMSKSHEYSCGVYDGFLDGVEWRDANPNPKQSIEVQIKPIIDDVIEPWKEKIEELVKNRARLEWTVKNNAIVHKRGDQFNIVSYGIPLRLYESFNSWRDAIDDGMKVQP